MNKTYSQYNVILNPDEKEFVENADFDFGELIHETLHEKMDEE